MALIRPKIFIILGVIWILLSLLGWVLPEPDHALQNSTLSSSKMMLEQQVVPSGTAILARWIWNTEEGSWEPPSQVQPGGIDLRAQDQLGPGPIAVGYGWWLLEPGQLAPVGSITLGKWSDRLTIEKTVVETALRLPMGSLISTTTDDLLVELLKHFGSAAGSITWPTFIDHRIYLANKLVYTSPQRWYESQATDPTWYNRSLALYRSGYDRLKTTESADTYLRVAGAWKDAFGFDVRSASQQQDGPLRSPHTTLNESWPTTTSDITDGSQNLAWSEPQANITVTGGTPGTANAAQDDPANTTVAARATAPLSSPDHYAQANVTWLSDTSLVFGTFIRFAASAYSGFSGGGNANADEDRIHRFDAGIPTQINAQAHTIGTETLNVKTSASGNTISVKVGAAATLNVTDTNYNTNLRGGIGGVNNSGGATWGAWEASDGIEEGGNYGFMF